MTTTTKPACIITFRAKKQESFYTDGTRAACWIQVPRLTKSHVDMAMARGSRKYGHYANSDLFLGMLNRELRAAGVDRGDGIRGALLGQNVERLFLALQSAHDRAEHVGKFGGTAFGVFSIIRIALGAA